MKILKYTITLLFISSLFTACSSKAQNEVINSNKEDVSELLKTLIKKEQEVNSLNQELEDCKKLKDVK